MLLEFLTGVVFTAHREHKVLGVFGPLNFNLGNKSLDFPILPASNVQEASSGLKSINGLIINPSYSDDTYNY